MADKVGLSEYQKALAPSFMVPFESAQQLKDWCSVFLGIDFPLGRVDPDSNSSPTEWLFEAYSAVRHNQGAKKPVFVVYSAREAFKTLSCSALEVILLAHFKLTIAHMAAIEPQSKKAVQYISSFLRKINPYLEYHGSKIESQNTRNIIIRNKEGEVCYLTIIIATLTGANSEHTNFMCIDGDSRISVRNIDTNSNRKRKNIAAKTLFKKLENGEIHDAISFNHLMGKMEFKKIIGWHKNYKQLYIIKTKDKTISATEDHRFFVAGKGYIPVSEIQQEDRLLFLDKSSGFGNKNQSESLIDLSIEPDHKDTTELDQFLLGSLLGDGGVYRKSENNAYYQETHCMEQKEYAEWKRSILSKTFLTRNYTSTGGYNTTEQYKISTGNTPLLNKWTSFKKTFDGIERLGPLGLAVWYMDDGCKGRGLRLSTEGFSYEQQIILRDLLKSNFNIHVEIKPSKGKYYFLQGSIEDQYKLYEICKNYIHPSMLYKFDHLLSVSVEPCECCGKEYLRQTVSHTGRYCADKICQAVKTNQFHLHPVVSIKKGSTGKVYDFTVEGNHNYIANGFLSHNCIDEVDVVRFPQAYEEAKLIPGMLNGRFPVTVMTSTRKFAFGLMQKEIESASEKGHPVLHWNIIDVTEHCSKTRHLPDEPKEDRYIARRLPLRNLSVQEYGSMQEEKRAEFDKITAYKGCASCILLPVCQTRLATRPETDVGALYKPIDFTINQFGKVNPDMGESQLLCWKPSSTGLIYGRFDPEEGQNVITLDQAYKSYTGNETEGTSLDDLIDLFHKKGINFYVGGDWGFRHAFALIAIAVLPNKEFWVFETLAIPGLEYEDMIKYAISFRDKYQPKRWFMDTAQPMFIKGFRRRKMICKEFKKDVMGGIESVRGQVVDASNKRRLKILKTDENAFLIKGFANHHFRTDASGNITQDPDDEEYADVMDSMRYIGQNLFDSKSQGLKAASGDARAEAHRRQRQELYKSSPEKAHSDILLNKIKNLTTEGSGESKGKSASGTILWDFGDPSDD